MYLADLRFASYYLCVEFMGCDLGLGWLVGWFWVGMSWWLCVCFVGDWLVLARIHCLLVITWL